MFSPEQARELRQGTTPGPWEWRDVIDEYNGDHQALGRPNGPAAIRSQDYESYRSFVYGTVEDKALVAAAPIMVDALAAMTTEWGVTYTGVKHGGRHVEWGHETRHEAETVARRYRRDHDMRPVTIVHRYVSGTMEDDQ